MNAVIEARTSREVVSRLRAFFRFPPPIVDVTWGRGRFWPSGEDEVIGMDRSAPSAPVVADWSALPLRDASVGTVIYDPPFLPSAGPNAIWLARGYGVGEAAWSFTGGFDPMPHLSFFREALRTLRSDGLMIVKTGDMIHSSRPYWLTLTIMDAARSVGFHLYDWIISYRPRPFIDPRWRTEHHVRKHHAHWTVWVPPGAKLER